MQPLTRAWMLALCALLLLPAVAAAQADPGGDENADLREPTGKLYGFSGIRPETNQPAVGDLAPEESAMFVDAVNGNATRTTLEWQALEPLQDDYEENKFARLHQLYSALIARDLEPIFVLAFAPRWARDAEGEACGGFARCHYPPAQTPAMLEEWREFVGKVAGEFPRAAIEVWNEPNYLSQWQSGPDPARYAQLLSIARSAAGPQTPAVYSGGLATDPKPGWVAAAQFLRQAYAAKPSLKGNTDAINFHVYPQRGELGAGSHFANVFGLIRDARADAGDAATPLLVTELGVSATGAGGVSEGEQGEILLRATRKVLTMGRDTLGVLIYSLTERPETSDERERGFGTIRATPSVLPGRYSYELKNSYCVLRSAARNPHVDCPRDTRIGSTPAEVAAARTVHFGSPDGGAGFRCSLDGEALGSCSSPFQLPSLATGQHTFGVRAAGILGIGTDPHPAEVEFSSVLHELEATVTPRKAKLKAGGKPKRFAVAVSAPGAGHEVGGVWVCVEARRKFVDVVGKDCRPAPPISPGEPTPTKFRLELRRKAEGRKVPVTFEATAEGANPDSVRAWVNRR